MAHDIEILIRIARDHAGQLRDTVGSAIWEICDEVERLRAAGDALAVALQNLGWDGINDEEIVQANSALLMWKEIRI